MKILKNHLILFDAECQICRAVVGNQLLENTEKIPYQQFNGDACPMLDRQRAVDEIALVNQETGEVLYGIHSLFKVMAVAFPVLKPLFLFRPFVWIMSKVYALIAYNRRVILPPPNATATFDLQPTFKRSYRMAYLVISTMVTAFILFHYAKLFNGAISDGKLIREYLIFGGQLFVQGAIVYRTNKEKRWDYLGNMMTITLGGALFLLPALLASHYLTPASRLYAAWFVVVTAVMFIEHVRRCKVLGIGFTLPISWMLYQGLILLIILRN